VVEKQLQSILQHWEKEGFGVYSVWSREDGSWIGRAGLRFTEQQDKKEYELLYAFMPQVWGKGYGAEVAEALIRMGFESLGAESIMAFTLTDNTGSRRIMEKCGMHFERKGTYKDLPHVWYRILRNSMDSDSRDSGD
jgi:RimJ/RimL family protein N-acetyltransferase